MVSRHAKKPKKVDADEDALLDALVAEAAKNQKSSYAGPNVNLHLKKKYIYIYIYIYNNNNNKSIKKKKKK
jgi:hypothetical protein